MDEQQRAALLRMAGEARLGSRLARRVRVVLLAADGLRNQEIAAALNLSPQSVCAARRRFLQHGVAGLREGRHGPPFALTAEKMHDFLIAMAKPQKGGRWTVRSLAAAQGMSRMAVHRLWRKTGHRPHVELLCRLEPASLTRDELGPLNRARSVGVEFRLANRVFRFPLGVRRLDMGKAGDIAYFWLKSDNESKDGQASDGGVIDFWWTQMRTAGYAGGEREIEHLVLAESYSLARRSKSVQRIFRDARLSASVDRDYELAADEARRLRQVAESGLDAVREELEQALADETVSAERRSELNRDAHRWLDRGKAAFHGGGRAGLRQWVNGELKRWMEKAARDGRRGGRADAQYLLFKSWTYECKAAFYVCYASLWAALLPFMEEAGVDARSLWFMRLWHNRADAPGGGVMKGLVLARHPLSELVMRQEHHRVAIGKWLRRADDNQIPEIGDFRCPEYNGVVAAILAAAQEYKHLWQAYQDSRIPQRGERIRGVRTPPSRKPKSPPRPDSTHPNSGPVSEAFDKYVQMRQLQCPKCGGRPVYDRHTKIGAGRRRSLQVTYRCLKCGAEGTHAVKAPARSGDR